MTLCRSKDGPTEELKLGVVIRDGLSESQVDDHFNESKTIGLLQKYLSCYVKDSMILGMISYSVKFQIAVESCVCQAAPVQNVLRCP